MASTETALAAVRLGLGPGALARPRQAALAAVLLLALAALAWLLNARPWNAPLPAAAPAGTAGTAAAAAPRQLAAAQLAGLLSRSGYGPGGSDVRALWATPEYFRFTQQAALAAQYDVEKHLVFLLWENIHDRDLPAAGLRPILRVNGTAAYPPAQVLVPADAVHHRFSVALYARYDAQGRPIVGEQARSLELVLPPANAEGARSILHWALPLEYPQPVTARFQLTWAALLALLGGMLVSMWPCLFQLTAYFIPTLAGLSMSQAERPDNPALLRLRVVKTAAFFILGFAIVYTAAGAAAGFAAQSLHGTSLFWRWQRPLSIAAGLVILFMALRIAVNSRAPLVCKMPVFPFLGKWSTSPLGTMLLGLAFATGCTTCFGAAVILGLVSYVGLAGTPLYGALIMFVFSLGMAIPLLAGAAAMARVLGLLCRLERVAPYMVLASSAVMAGFAALLLSGRFMTFSNWFFSNARL